MKVHEVKMQALSRSVVARRYRIEFQNIIKLLVTQWFKAWSIENIDCNITYNDHLFSDTKTDNFDTQLSTNNRTLTVHKSTSVLKILSKKLVFGEDSSFYESGNHSADDNFFKLMEDRLFSSLIATFDFSVEDEVKQEYENVQIAAQLNFVALGVEFTVSLNLGTVCHLLKTPINQPPINFDLISIDHALQDTSVGISFFSKLIHLNFIDILELKVNDVVDLEHPLEQSFTAIVEGSPFSVSSNLVQKNGKKSMYLS